MPSYKKYLVCTSLLLCLSGCSSDVVNLNTQTTIKKQDKFTTVQTKKFVLEDQYIMFALEYENQRALLNARELYQRLFNNTNKYEYLVKYLTISFQISDFNTVKDSYEKHFIANIKEEEELLRLYTLSLFRLKQYDLALKNGKILYSKYNKPMNIELYATLLLQKKMFDEAIQKFQEAFNLNNNANTLLSLVNIQYYYADKKQKAKKNLLDYINKNGYIYNLSVQLLSFYEQEKQVDKIVELLEKMYSSYKSMNNEAIYKRTRDLLTRYYARKDIYHAIDFLEKENPDDKLLLVLYRSSNQPIKAYDLLNKLYNKTKNLDYLAQIAILEFELANDKQKVLDSVIEKFDKALKKIDNPMYQNYLAYLLIDYDKNIKKGLSLVKKALKKEPENLAYIDTLAWGEYKAKNCKEAFTQMKRVVDKAGLDDIEIKLHWEKIKECTK